MTSPAFRRLCSWDNLVLAWRDAARGKRGTAGVARFEYRAEEHVADLRERLLAGTYRPGPYVHFHIKDPSGAGSAPPGSGTGWSTTRSAT